MAPYGPQHYAPQQPQPHNPYDPSYRQNVFVPQGAAPAGPVPSPTVRNLKLVAGIVQILALFAMVGFFVAGGVMADGRGDDSPAGALVGFGIVSFAVWYLVLIGYGVLNLVWMYKIWGWVPPQERHTKMWRKYISPGTAVGFMLIPYFNIYWMFVMYLGLCDVFDRLRVAYPTSQLPPKNLAIATLVVPIVFFPAGPFMHFVFDRQIEALARETQARMPAGAGAWE